MTLTHRGNGHACVTLPQEGFCVEWLSWAPKGGWSSLPPGFLLSEGLSEVGTCGHRTGTDAESISARKDPAPVLLPSFLQCSWKPKGRS